MTEYQRKIMTRRLTARLAALNDDGLNEAFTRVCELARLPEYASGKNPGTDKHIKIIRKGTAEITTGEFSSLQMGDQVYIDGQIAVLAENARSVPDPGREGGLHYTKLAAVGPDRIVIFPEDCDSPEVD